VPLSRIQADSTTVMAVEHSRSPDCLPIGFSEVATHVVSPSNISKSNCGVASDFMVILFRFIISVWRSGECNVLQSKTSAQLHKQVLLVFLLLSNHATSSTVLVSKTLIFFGWIVRPQPKTTNHNLQPPWRLSLPSMVVPYITNWLSLEDLAVYIARVGNKPVS
jgi:hypothetical protein